MVTRRTPASKTPAKRATSAAAKKPPAPAPAPTQNAPKRGKPAKIKLIRDSFTIPKTEYAAIEELKKRAARAGLPSKKSELLRAGIMALAAMGDGSFQVAMDAVPRLKTGRPKKH